MTPHLLSIIAFVAAFGQATADEDKVKQLSEGDVVTVSEWARELNAVSVAFRPRTEIDRNDETPKFIERVGGTLAGKVLKITGEVESLRWKDGVGYLKVNLAGAEKADKLKVRFPAEVKVEMDKEAAKTIEMGQSFELRAVADFNPRAVGPINNKKARHVASVTSDGAINQAWVGSFTTQVYEVRVAGKVYKGIWQTNP